MIRRSLEDPTYTRLNTSLDGQSPVASLNYLHHTAPILRSPIYENQVATASGDSLPVDAKRVDIVSADHGLVSTLNMQLPRRPQGGIIPLTANHSLNPYIFNEVQKTATGLELDFANFPLPPMPEELRISLSKIMFGPTINQNDGQNQRTKISHQCQVCLKTFSRPCSVKIHMYKHTGEKPYGCPHQGCSHRFSVRSNLKRHISAVHEKIKLMKPPSIDDV